MTQQIIDTGVADQGNGDPIRTAFTKVNANFDELYSQLAASVVVGATAPTGPEEGSLWWNSESGRMYVYYGTAWVDASPVDGAGISSTNQLVNGAYTASLGANGVLTLPDGSIINGSTIRGIAGTGELNYTGITIGPNSNDAEKTWMWVDHANAYVSTNNAANTWTFDEDGGLKFPKVGNFTPTTEIYATSGGDQYILESYYAEGRGSGTYLKLDADSGIVTIQSGGPSKQWQFGADGSLITPGTINAKTTLAIETIDLDTQYDQYLATVEILANEFLIADYTGQGYPASKDSYAALVRAKALNPLIPDAWLPLSNTLRNAYFTWAASSITLTVDGGGFVIANGGGVSWRFDEATGLRFPDNTYQTTAFVGSALRLKSTNGSQTVTLGNDGLVTFPGETGFQATFGSVEPVGDVLHSVNNLHLESEQSVTVNSGNDVFDLYNDYQIKELTWETIRDQNSQVLGPRPWDDLPGYQAYPLLQDYTPTGLELPIPSNMLEAAEEASVAYYQWLSAFNSSEVNISVAGSHVWNFGADGELTVPGIITKDDALQLVSGGTTNSSSVNVYGDLGKVLIRTNNGTSNKDWQFNVDGTLTFPSGAGFGLGESGQLKANDSTTLSLDFRDSSGRGFYTNSDGFTLRSNGSNNWMFKSIGTLNLPNFGAVPGAGDGAVGDICRNGDVLYFKTSSGWATIGLTL